TGITNRGQLPRIRPPPNGVIAYAKQLSNLGHPIVRHMVKTTSAREEDKHTGCVHPVTGCNASPPPAGRSSRAANPWLRRLNRSQPTRLAMSVLAEKIPSLIQNSDLPRPQMEAIRVSGSLQWAGCCRSEWNQLRRERVDICRGASVSDAAPRQTQSGDPLVRGSGS